jgi:hypothetical protein
MAQPVLRLYEGTSSASGATLTKTANCDPGFTLGAFTAGKATLTIPKCKRAVVVACGMYNNTDTAGSVHLLYVKSIDPTGGTVALSTLSADATAVTSDQPDDGDIIQVLLLVDEGSS